MSVFDPLRTSSRYAHWPNAQGRSSLGRIDPCRNFNFRLLSGDRVVAVLSEAANLKLTTPLDHRNNGSLGTEVNRVDSKLEAILLKRGLICDREFGQWAIAAGSLSSSGEEGSGAAIAHRELVLEAYDEAQQPVLAYEIRRCWVSKVELSGYSPDTKIVPFDLLQLEHQGVDFVHIKEG